MHAWSMRRVWLGTIVALSLTVVVGVQPARAKVDRLKVAVAPLG